MEESGFSLMEIPSKPYRSRGRGRGRGRGKRKKAKVMKTPEKKVKQKQSPNKQKKQKKQTDEKKQPEKEAEKKKTEPKKKGKKSGSKSKPKKKVAEKPKSENTKKNQEGGKKKKVAKKSSKKKAPKSEGNVKKGKDAKGKQAGGEKKKAQGGKKQNKAPSKGKGKAADKKVNKQQAQKKSKPGKKQVKNETQKKKQGKDETQKKKQGKGETQQKKQKQKKTQKQGKAGKAQKSQKKSQKKPQTQQQSGAAKQTKKGKKRKMNIRSRLLGYCRKAKPEAKVIAMFSQELINDIRFKGKFSSRIEISLNNEGMRSYRTKPAVKKPQEQPKKQQKAKSKTEKVQKKAQPQKKAQAKKKKVSVRDEFFKACRATKTEKDLIAQFGQKLIDDVRLKDKFKSRIEITVDKEGNRSYTTKRSLKAQRKKERNLRKNGIRAAYKNFVDMGSAANFEACQNEIREHFADWSETDSNFLQKLHENEVFKKECTFPVLFWNLTSSVNTFEFIKRVSAFGESNAKRLSPNQLIVNFKAKDAATKCINKLNNTLIQGRKIPCKLYLTQNVESSV